MRGGRPSTVSLVDCLTRDSAGCALVGGLRAGLNQYAGQTSPIRTPRFAARLRRRKSALGFHLFAQDSRPEAKDPVHPGHRHPVPVGRFDPVARRQLPERAEVRGAGQWRRLGADLLVDQPVLRRCAAASDGVRGRRNALHHREHHRAAADGGHSAFRAAAQRGPGRPGQDDAVHPLPGGRAGHPAGHQHRGAGRQRRAAAGLHPRHHPGPESGPEHLHAGRHRAGDDRGRGAGDVDGRAGHRARHRQWHVAADLRRHRRAHPGRRQDHPGQPRRPCLRPGLSWPR